MHYSPLITRNAQRLRDLQALVKTTHASGDRDTPACHRAADFAAQYDTLAFPGGLSTARARIAAGNRDAIEAALSFLELRPYFHRSGYIRNDLFRDLKCLPPQSLPPEHAQRLADCLETQRIWRE